MFLPAGGGEGGGAGTSCGTLVAAAAAGGAGDVVPKSPKPVGVNSFVGNKKERPGNPAIVYEAVSKPLYGDPRRRRDGHLKEEAQRYGASETAFIYAKPASVGAGGASSEDINTKYFQIKWFSGGGVRMALCGHATLAAADVVLEGLDDGRVVFYYGAPEDDDNEPEETIIVDKYTSENGEVEYSMEFSCEEIEDVDYEHDQNLSKLREIFGEDEGIICHYCPNQKKYIIQLASEQKFRDFRLTDGVIEKIKELNNPPQKIRGIYITARRDGQENEYFAMQLSPAINPILFCDPATGASLVAFLSAVGEDGKEVTVLQWGTNYNLLEAAAGASAASSSSVASSAEPEGEYELSIMSFLKGSIVGTKYLIKGSCKQVRHRGSSMDGGRVFEYTGESPPSPSLSPPSTPAVAVANLGASSSMAASSAVVSGSTGLEDDSFKGMLASSAERGISEKQ
jgi:predicted PhzF superfamily epimerase YddE/YHI9